MHMLTSQCCIRWHTHIDWRDQQEMRTINESSRASVLDFRFYLAMLYFFFFYFQTFTLMTAVMPAMAVLQPAHLCDATEHLQLCTVLVSLFRGCNSTFSFPLFLPLPCCIISLFFRFFFKFCTFVDSSHAAPTRTVLQSAHLSDATEYLQPSTVLLSFLSWWVEEL